MLVLILLTTCGYAGAALPAVSHSGDYTVVLTYGQTPYQLGYRTNTSTGWDWWDGSGEDRQRNLILVNVFNKTTRDGKPSLKKVSGLSINVTITYPTYNYTTGFSTNRTTAIALEEDEERHCYYGVFYYPNDAYTGVYYIDFRNMIDSIDISFDTNFATTLWGCQARGCHDARSTQTNPSERFPTTTVHPNRIVSGSLASDCQSMCHGPYASQFLTATPIHLHEIKFGHEGGFICGNEGAVTIFEADDERGRVILTMDTSKPGYPGSDLVRPRVQTPLADPSHVFIANCTDCHTNFIHDGEGSARYNIAKPRYLNGTNVISTGVHSRVKCELCHGNLSYPSIPSDQYSLTGTLGGYAPMFTSYQRSEDSFIINVSGGDINVTVVGDDPAYNLTLSLIGPIDGTTIQDLNTSDNWHGTYYVPSVNGSASFTTGSRIYRPQNATRAKYTVLEDAPQEGTWIARIFGWSPGMVNYTITSNHPIAHKPIIHIPWNCSECHNPNPPPDCENASTELPIPNWDEHGIAYAHADVPCRSCHNSLHEISILNCVECHRGLSGGHREITEMKKCLVCHFEPHYNPVRMGDPIIVKRIDRSFNISAGEIRGFKDIIPEYTAWVTFNLTWGGDRLALVIVRPDAISSTGVTISGYGARYNRSEWDLNLTDEMENIRFNKEMALCDGNTSHRFIRVDNPEPGKWYGYVIGVNPSSKAKLSIEYGINSIAGCTGCHDFPGFEKGIHAGMNGAESDLNRSCWACHGDGDMPSSHPGDVYLFRWDDVPGNSNDNKTLLDHLRDDYNIGWAEGATIRKSDDNRTIRVFDGENSAEITIDEKEEKATLKISDGRVYDLEVKKRNGKLNVYKDAEKKNCNNNDCHTFDQSKYKEPMIYEHFKDADRLDNRGNITTSNISTTVGCEVCHANSLVDTTDPTPSKTYRVSHYGSTRDLMAYSDNIRTNCTYCHEDEENSEDWGDAIDPMDEESPMIDEDEEATLHAGDLWELRNGYIFKVVSVDLNGNNARVRLSRNGELLNQSVVSMDIPFEYEKTITVDGRTYDQTIVSLNLTGVMRSVDGVVATFEGRTIKRIHQETTNAACYACHAEGYARNSRYNITDRRGDVTYYTKVVVDFEYEGNQSQTLASGDDWNLGDGFVLAATAIDADGDLARLELRRNGTTVEEYVVHTGDVFKYEADIPPFTDVCIFRANVSGIFRSYGDDLIVLRDVRLISPDLQSVDVEDDVKVDDYNVSWIAVGEDFGGKEPDTFHVPPLINGRGIAFADCVHCHDISSGMDIKCVNAIDSQLGAHAHLNRYAENETVLSDSIDKACWACHGIGTEPSVHPDKKPEDCADCHVHEILFDATDLSDVPHGRVKNCTSCHGGSGRDPHVITMFGAVPHIGDIKVSPQICYPGEAVRLSAIAASGWKLEVRRAEYFMDSMGADGTGTPMEPVDGAFDCNTEEIEASIDTSKLPVGNHTIYVHAMESKDTWGSVASVTLEVKQGKMPGAIRTIAPFISMHWYAITIAVFILLYAVKKFFASHKES